MVLQIVDALTRHTSLGSGEPIVVAQHALFEHVVVAGRHAGVARLFEAQVFALGLAHTANGVSGESAKFHVDEALVSPKGAAILS